MATVTHAGTAVWTTTAGNKTVPAASGFAVAVGDLIVVIAPATGVANSAVTDNNPDGLGTYTKIGSSFTGWSTAGDLSIWVRNALIGSATNTTWTLTQTSSTGGGGDIFRVSGMTKTGASAVRSSGGQSTGTAGTTPAPVLSLTPSTFNPVITAVCNGTSPGGVTGPATYTAPTNLGYATPTSGLDTAFINSGITSATITWGSTSATAFGSVAIELDTGGPTGPPLASSLQQPAGLVVSLVRTGVAMATPFPGPVINPARGPAFTPFRWPVQAQDPLAGQRQAGPGPRGRVYGISAGGPVQNPPSPVTGPVFYPARQAVRAGLPQPPAGMGAMRGRCASSPPAPVRNPTPGPAFRSRPAPVRYILPPWQPRAGRVTSNPGARVANPRRGPPFYPFTSEIRAAFGQQPLLRGRAAANPGGPVANPNSVAVSGAVSGPVRAPMPANPRGRVRATPLSTAAGTPPVHSGPPFFPVPHPVRAPVPQVFSRGRSGSSTGAPVRNPSQGPAFRQATQPARVRIPQVFSKGRVASNPGTATYSGPAFRQATSPARVRPALPPRGRTGSNPGGPVRNPAPGGTGPVFYPRNFARPQQPLPRRGTCRAIRFGPLPANPAPGPAFTQATSPVRVHPALPPRGRVASNAGGPLRNPPPPVLGPVFRQATSPARIRPSLPPRGRVSANPGGPVRNPAAGPAVYPAHGPVRAPVPQVFSKGRVGSNPGGPVVFPVVPAPVFPLHGPVRIRPALPPRGRTAGSAGIPVSPPPVPAPVYPAHGPVMARRPLPPHGRVITGNPGAPVRNPRHGPVFRSLPWPARTRIPQNAPRGRAAGNPGGQVQNIPFATLLFRLGSPYFRWETETPGLTSEWATGSPAFSWAAGVPETSA